MKRNLALAVLVVILAAAFAPQRAAAGWATGYGCFVCLDQGTGLTPNERCWQVGNNQWGEGWYCSEQRDFLGWLCSASGGACYNINVSGGGGSAGGSGGGTGQGCIVPAGASCPPSCSSCSHEAFPRPAV